MSREKNEDCGFNKMQMHFLYLCAFQDMNRYLITIQNYDSYNNHELENWQQK